MTSRTCPHCAAPIKETAISCPMCGSDEQTGWSDSASADWLLPDYEEIIANEFGCPPKKKSLKAIGVLVVLFLLAFSLIYFML